MNNCAICVALAATLFLTAGPAHGGEVTTFSTYALLVASHRGGEGQQPLRHSTDDAIRIRSVLQDVGGYRPGNITLITDPDNRTLRSAIESQRRNLAAHARRGDKTMFFFYYSGHARSSSLNLGPDEFALKELRQLLSALPATTTIVVLDACQAGEISGVKGVGPAGAFSYNSVADLTAEGMVVMASSSANELSQESAALRGSYFTHHLAVAMRGAADANGDGRVTLHEAYDYTYHRTLESTARTAIGRQHPTLETDLRGRGELVISQPGKTTSRLRISSAISGDMLITRRDNRIVMAEIRKVGGEQFSVSLVPGEYEVLVRILSNQARLCQIRLREHELLNLDLSRCEVLTLERPVSKGEDVLVQIHATRQPPSRREILMLEAHLGYFSAGGTPYTDSLAAFGYGGLADGSGLAWKLGLSLSIVPALSIVGIVSSLERREARQEAVGSAQSVQLDSYRLGGGVRGSLPLSRGRVVPYVQFSGGWAFSDLTLNYDNSIGRGSDQKRTDGFFVAAAAGLQLNPWRLVGFTLLELEYIGAESIKNPAVDDRHSAGGFAFSTAIRVGYGLR